jgi:CRP-like cAMP-binding protein
MTRVATLEESTCWAEAVTRNCICLFDFIDKGNAVENVATPEFRPIWGPRNKLLDMLQSATSRRISPYLQSVPLKRGAVVCEAGGVINYAYFPTGCVLSLQTVLENGSAIETANLGSEGAFGLSAVLSRRVPFVRSVVRLQGVLIRCPLDALREEVGDKLVCHLCAVNSESISTQVQQNMVCNARHGTAARLCRWLLTMHDRAGGESPAYPQTFFAGILGETYGSVALAAQTLQDDGLVTCRRGTVHLVDRPGLEQASCDCYAVVKRRLDA